MSFETGWLDLREGADNAARDPALRDYARAHLDQTRAPLIVDLGAGTGSTMRALDAGTARWRLLDNDPKLLAEASRRGGDSAETVELDLTQVNAIPLSGATLVTASALFDLVSPDWIDALADRLAQDRIGLYAALSYDGVLEWDPADSDDAAACSAFNMHQRTNKGFGAALGPFGASYLADAMRKRGYRVMTGQSPWVLGSADADLQRALLSGIAGAARESGMEQADDWLARRSAIAHTSRCTVGHLDVLALPV